MVNNKVSIKVILNHIEERNFDNKLFYIYTFTDFNSGNSFDVWVTQNIDFLDKISLLTQSIVIIFDVVIKKDGKIKLIPLEISK